MNDLMSGGVHRLWKAAMIDWLNPRPGQRLVDVAGGVDDGFTGCKVIKNHRDRALVLTVLDTGLRLGEIAGLQVADLQDGWLQVDGKTGERQVPVSPEVLWT